jgi:hypothetical protein
MLRMHQPKVAEVFADVDPTAEAILGEAPAVADIGVSKRLV